MKPNISSPLDFFALLKWLDGRPLLDTIEPYRRRLFMDALFTFDETGRPRYNMVLAGRAKKNSKTTDLVLASLYRLLVWPTAQGNDSYILAADEGQAADDLSLAKKLVAVNPVLEQELTIMAKSIARRDGNGALTILPARDIAGSHGKTYLTCSYDEIHSYRSWDIFEALAPDPTRPDVLTWITSYASLVNRPGIPLYDLFEAGKRGDDVRMLFSWYAADYTTDPTVPEDATPEQRANPSLSSWPDQGYLEQQRRRLPAGRYRRLHLNLPGSPDGAALPGEAIEAAIVAGRKALMPQPGVSYVAYVDMSGGSSDDAVLAIAHRDEQTQRIVLDRIETQTGKPPFNPRDAVLKFVSILETYRVARVVGDRYAGQTFREDFRAKGIEYVIGDKTASQLYEALEPRLNAREVELLDNPRLHEQLYELVMRGGRISHPAGGHDDLANAVAGVIAVVGLRTAPLEFWTVGDSAADSNNEDLYEERNGQKVAKALKDSGLIW